MGRCVCGQACRCRSRVLDHFHECRDSGRQLSDVRIRHIRLYCHIWDFNRIFAKTHHFVTLNGTRPAPPPRRAGSPSAAPCRAARLSPWAAAPPPSGGRLGRLRRPFSPPPPPGVGIIRPSACRQGLRKWPIRATLDGGPLARSVLINGARLPCGIIFVSPRKWLTSSNGCAIIGGARETPNRRHFGAQMTVTAGGLSLFLCPKGPENHPNPLPSPAP